jgi:hypothetical protein
MVVGIGGNKHGRAGRGCPYYCERRRCRVLPDGPGMWGVVIGGLVLEMRDGMVGRVDSSREILAVIMSAVCVSA